MLPNLNHLSLHDVANTMGFYEPTEEEQAAMNDDPVTLEKPLYTMTFRVRLPDDGPNGEPRYKFFAPAELWRWVKDHDTLPSREGPIWYEDWWVLCNNFNPDHHDVPAWAHRLKRRSEYVAERAREQAAQAQQAARANARANREEANQDEEDEEDEERGRVDADDYVVYWTFYLKWHIADTSMVLRSARACFANYMRTVQPVLFGPSAARRLLITFDLGFLPPFRATPRQDVTKLSCRVYFSTASAARSFAEWLNGHIREHGYAEAMKLMLGVSTAKSVVDTVALLDESEDLYSDYTPGEQAAIARQDAPFSLTPDQFRDWPDTEIRDPPESSEAPAADPILAFRPPGSEETDVTIRWRFWLKGPMDEEQRTSNAIHWGRAFSDLFSDAPGVPELRTSIDPWYDRLWVWIHEEEPRIRGPRTGLRLSDGVIQRCEFALKLPANAATAWLEIVNQDLVASWNGVAQTWFYVEPVKSNWASDRPQVRNWPLYPLLLSPLMTEADYNAWETWRSIPRFRAIGEPR